MRHTLKGNAGETFELSVRYKDSTGQPVDLTGTTARFDVKSVSDGDVLFTYPATTSPDGWINVKVTDEETAGWSRAKYAYSLVVIFSNGDEKWLLFGPFMINNGWNY